jgi:hypothetical protein
LHTKESLSRINQNNILTLLVAVNFIFPGVGVAVLAILLMASLVLVLIHQQAKRRQVDVERSTGKSPTDTPLCPSGPVLRVVGPSQIRTPTSTWKAVLLKKKIKNTMTLKKDVFIINIADTESSPCISHSPLNKSCFKISR